jgi:hypothetical protein
MTLLTHVLAGLSAGIRRRDAGSGLRGHETPAQKLTISTCYMKKKHILHLTAAAIMLSAPMAFGTTLYDSTILGDHPVSYWPMQETNGPIIYDVVGTNNGTMMVGTDTAPAGGDVHAVFATNDGSAFIMGSSGALTNIVPPDTCIYFENTNACEISVPYSATLDVLTFSAEAWLEIPDFVSPFVTSNVDMVPLGFEWNTGAQYGWWWDMDDGKSGTHPGQFTFQLGKSSASGWQSDTGPGNNNNNGKWVYLVSTYDGNNWTGYYNGASVSSQSGASYLQLKNKSTAIALVMGSYDNSGTASRSRFYGGGMAHVAVYNYALTAGQVLNHYIVATLGATPPIIGTEPIGFTNYIGYTNTLTVAAAGTPLFYQWYNGSNTVAGATNASLVLQNLQLTNAGNYSVTVSNAAGSTNSVVAPVGVLPLPANVYQAALISEFPSAYYPLNETTGTTANDMIQAGVANQNEAAYVNGPALGNPGASSYLGSAVDLDGATQGVVVTNANAMNITGDTTMEAWVQITDTNFDQFIVGHGPYPNNDNPSQVANILGITVDYNLTNNPNSNGYYFIERYQETATPTNVGAYCPIPSADLPQGDGAAGPWVYLAATADGTAWNLYRNGVLVATTPDTTGAGPANGGWGFGARNDTLAAQAPFFWGGIQDVAIYSYALSPATIQQHYQLGLAGVYTHVTPQPVSIQQSGGNAVLSWTAGSLESAPSLSGPWTFLTNPDSSVVASPYSVAATNSQQFFQATLGAP